MSTAADATGPPWRRLHRRTVLVTALVTAGVAVGAAVPAVAGLVRAAGLSRGHRLGPGRSRPPDRLCHRRVDHVRWRRTRYRVGGERVELHTGLLLVKRRSLARERIRSVDLTAHPLQRILGLVTVRIGTGDQTGGESTLELDPVARAEGERLRRDLLDRAARAAQGTHRDGELARFDLRWIRYAPVSFVAPMLGGAAAGGVLQISDWVGAQGEVIDWVADRFRDTPLVWAIVVLVLTALVSGVVGALGLWVETWWNYRLEREPGGTLRVRRGLLTSRSLSVEERRLRGVDLVEPLGVRLTGAARLDAITTGLAKDEEAQGRRPQHPAAGRAPALRRRDRRRGAARATRTDRCPAHAAPARRPRPAASPGPHGGPRARCWS